MRRLILALLLATAANLLNGVVTAQAPLLWVDAFSESGGSAEVHKIAVTENKVFAVGITADSSGNYDFLVRSYNALTGALAWQDKFDNGDFDNGSAIAVSGNLVIAGGVSVVDGQTRFLIRAYNATSGVLLWQDLAGTLSEASLSSEADAVAIQDNRVFASGMLDGQFVVRAYNATSGALLWQDQFTGGGGCCPSGQALALAAHGNGLFATGWTATAVPGTDIFVRAYDPASGNLLWQDQYDRPASADGDQDLAGSIDADEDLVVVTGLSTFIFDTNSKTEGIVRAYDLLTGSLSWQDLLDPSSVAHDVVIAANRVYVGAQSSSVNGENDFLLRAYQASNGSLAWEDRVDKGGSEEAIAVAASDGKVFAAGQGNGNLLLRSYSDSGLLLWEDYVGAGDDGFFAVAAGTSVVAAGGRALNNSGTQDFLVRAYDTGNNQTVQTAFFLRGSGSTANPPILSLEAIAPTSATAKYKDSPGINFNGGNPWREVGVWPASATPTGTLLSLADLTVWLGLKNSDDVGTNFDLRAVVYRNGVQISAGEAYCIAGVARSPGQAKETNVNFGSVVNGTFGAGDVLSLRVFTRIGTNGAGAFCGGHSNAVGLRLYFDAASRASGFDGNFGP